MEMSRPPIGTNQLDSQPARVPAIARPALERPVSGFVRTRRERFDVTVSPSGPVPAEPAAILGRVGTRLLGRQPARALYARGHRRAWNHDRPGRDRRSHLRRRDRQIRQGSGSVFIQRPANRHITKGLRITRRGRPPPHLCCRVASGANGERCAGSPSP